MFATDDRAAPAVPAGLELASYRRRIVGAVVDQFLVLAPVAIGLVVWGYRPGDEFDPDSLLLLNALTALTAFAYETLMIATTGRTVGKYVAGTRAVRADTGGELGWFASVQRALVPLVAGAVPQAELILGSIVYGAAFFDPLRRGIHDRAAGSLVVRHGVAAERAG